ncbi:uncharacterized protein BHQ10_006688 [Talaromyces amestolkiae]|uniref:ER lumen protein-retaining receptor n=1 Tax=Talaromyces amestolkiae TaxID=1196081 RepID=A0A364L4F4_TALAM|nr:uncharacterized protein BHQ10_006688 [Talaromyces amestolkiae]RAO70676.1 hypothetical protein BHQ10_006688 [Talaromyces amestolkiae]
MSVSMSASGFRLRVGKVDLPHRTDHRGGFQLMMLPKLQYLQPCRRHLRILRNPYSLRVPQHIVPRMRLWIDANTLAVVGLRDLTVEAFYLTIGTTVCEIPGQARRVSRKTGISPLRLVRPLYRLLKVVHLMYPYYLLQRGLGEPLAIPVVTRHGRPLQHQDALRLHLMRHMHRMHRPRDPDIGTHTVLQLMTFIVRRLIDIAAMPQLLPLAFDFVIEKRLMNLKADEGKLVEQALDKQMLKRQGLRDWDRLQRESALNALRSELAEAHLQRMTEEDRLEDLFWTFTDSLYNTVFKILFIGSSTYTIYLMLNDYKPTQDPNTDTFKVEYLLGFSALLAILFPQQYTISEILWTFSIWLESVAILPQLFMLQRTGEADTITTHYLFALGIYRALYIPNWIYRFFFEGFFHAIPVLAGIIQTVLYSDFFYIYYTK